VVVGLEVEFERQEGDRGPRAANVRRAGGGAAAPGPRPPAPARQGPRPPRDEPAALNELPVPRAFQAAVSAVRVEDRHPGLQLDRLVIPGTRSGSASRCWPRPAPPGTGGCSPTPAAAGRRGSGRRGWSRGGG
jgi:hypothetical protein